MGEYISTSGLGYVRVTPLIPGAAPPPAVNSGTGVRVTPGTTPEYVATPLASKLSNLTMVTAGGQPAPSTCTPACREGAICLNGRCVRPGTPPPPPTREPEDFENDLDIPPEDEYEDLYANGNGAGSNLFLYGGIFLLLAAVAGGGYWWWTKRSKAEKEEEGE